ncbi:MAG: 3-deoxy-D-manno-octulosonic acid transferase [Alphaproteobacteria bacterium]
MTYPLSLYQTLMGSAPAGWALSRLLNKRLARGKEDEARLGERRGEAGQVRPDGPVIWLHGASVGEALSALSLIDAILLSRPDVTLLVTTGTVTSARLMQERLPERAVHQFVPIDRPQWVARFLDHWTPDLALWMESELWPAALMALDERNIPRVLLNARMSEGSLRNWSRLSGTAQALVGGFALCLAQSAEEAERFAALGAAQVDVPGNLKYSSAPLPVDQKALQAFQSDTQGRPCWFFASSHPGEEEQVAAIHAALAARLPDVLTVLQPRHPERGRAVAALLRSEGAQVALRSAEEDITAETGIYIADTLGESGLFMRACPIVMMGGSLVPHGGHNPIEPAQLGAAILWGPHMFNFNTICAELLSAKAAVEYPDARAASAGILKLMRDESARQELAQAASGVAEANRQVVRRVITLLNPLLPGQAP